MDATNDDSKNIEKQVPLWELLDRKLSLEYCDIEEWLTKLFHHILALPKYRKVIYRQVFKRIWKDVTGSRDAELLRPKEEDCECHMYGLKFPFPLETVIKIVENSHNQEIHSDMINDPNEHLFNFTSLILISDGKGGVQLCLHIGGPNELVN